MIRSFFPAGSYLSSHTTTADGYVIVNRLRTTNGTITVEVPQGSVADWFLRKWARWARSLQDPNRIALGVMTIQDTVAGYTIVATGVFLQKAPDRVFDRTAGVGALVTGFLSLQSGSTLAQKLSLSGLDTERIRYIV